MYRLLGGVLMATIMAAALPVAAQTQPPPTGTPSRSSQQVQPGTGGVSKPDMPGLPGSKAGPTVNPSAVGRAPRLAAAAQLRKRLAA
jgi:hypothetical protein